jgi:hypothetical protein
VILVAIGWGVAMMYLLAAATVAFLFGGILLALMVMGVATGAIIKTYLLTKNRDGRMLGRVVATVLGGIVGFAFATAAAATEMADDFVANIDTSSEQHSPWWPVVLQGVIGFTAYGLPAAMLMFYAFGRIERDRSVFEWRSLGDMVVSACAGFVAVAAFVAMLAMQETARTLP